MSKVGGIPETSVMVALALALRHDTAVSARSTANLSPQFGTLLILFGGAELEFNTRWTSLPRSGRCRENDLRY